MENLFRVIFQVRCLGSGKESLGSFGSAVKLKTKFISGLTNEVMFGISAYTVFMNSLKGSSEAISLDGCRNQRLTQLNTTGDGKVRAESGSRCLKGCHHVTSRTHVLK